ncbi:hypothetical protein NQ315_006160 [Exocentrus adspersus]|uniref:Membrane protein BRI3 n=1 Tax=Exocentrus adspersus TaxID=1586481 RepID=A0AAV8VZZ1_9CUCU|nr:hypothetical protein NQ315_006160 [Exocentrus adspersus]
MERKEMPPPYDSGFNNQGYGQPYGNMSASAPLQSPVYQQPAPQPAPTLVQPVHTNSTTSTTVVVGGGRPGGCPICHNGSWTGTYSCCAWLLCIFCFPCGLVCCLCMRKKEVHQVRIHRCLNCRHTCNFKQILFFGFISNIRRSFLLHGLVFRFLS